jgi:phosphonate transport system permease protein
VPERRAAAIDRMLEFLASFGAPDLSRAYLLEALRITIDTLAIALLGTLFGVIVGYLLALGAARSVLVGESSPPPGRGGSVAASAAARLRRATTELFRLVLDVLRGVPDFAWAILILTIPGPGPVAAALAIGMNVAGILGKMYSEMWDAVPPRRYEAVRAAGGGRLATLWFGIQPLAARSMLSFTLMRTECAIRNASVIGIISRGGLGARMFEEFNFGAYDKVVTLLLFTILLTASADLLSNFLRHQLRSDPNHPRASRGQSFANAMTRRAIGAGAIALAIGGSLFSLRGAFDDVLYELGRIDWDWIARDLGRLLRPDLSWPTVSEAITACFFPLAIGLLGTMGSVALAGALVYPASVAFQAESHKFTGERVPHAIRLGRWTLLLAARGLALLFRAVPEVAWILVLAIFFSLGVIPGLLAVVLHSAGVLARVFTESVDNIPYGRYESLYGGSRSRTFLYAALPEARADWWTYSFFQFESNVRAGVVLGVIGIGGIGDSFHTSFVHGSLHRASTFLLAMIALTVLIDRLARWRHARTLVR